MEETKVRTLTTFCYNSYLNRIQSDVKIGYKNRLGPTNCKFQRYSITTYGSGHDNNFAVHFLLRRSQSSDKLIVTIQSSATLHTPPKKSVFEKIDCLSRRSKRVWKWRITVVITLLSPPKKSVIVHKLCTIVKKNFARLNLGDRRSYHLWSTLSDRFRNFRNSELFSFLRAKDYSATSD